MKSVEERAVRVVIDRMVSRERAKEHLIGLWRALIVDAEEPIKARELLERCVRFDLEDDLDIADLRRQSVAMIAHLDSREAELRSLLDYENSRPEQLPDEAFALVSMPSRIRWIGAYLAEHKPTSVLDLCAGYGHTSTQLLYYLALSGAAVPPKWVAASADTDVFAQGRAFCERKQVPIEFAACRELFCADAPEGPFDVVLLLETLEHVSDPTAMLDEALQRGRKVIVSVPGADTLDGRAARASFDAPRHHVRQFTPRTLATLLRIAESEVTTVSSIPNDIGVTYAAIVDGRQK